MPQHLFITESAVVQVFGWDASGTITFNDMLCTNNSAEEYGGCFHGSGKGVFNNGTVMLDNHAEHGGSICENIMYAATVILWWVCFMGRFGC